MGKPKEALGGDREKITEGGRVAMRQTQSFLNAPTGAPHYHDTFKH